MSFIDMAWVAVAILGGNIVYSAIMRSARLLARTAFVGTEKGED